jgi:transcriptional regulator with XRE-family HTH domain
VSEKDKPTSDTLTSMIISQLSQFSGQMASSAKEVAKSAATMSSLWGDGWVKDILLKSMDPERIQAMADAGHFLKDAREVAGLNLSEMSAALGLNDTELLEEVESGKKLLPFEMIFRSASLLARHDPIPFIIKFLRTYNPALEERLEAWGLSALPKQYERERRFVNIYRKHDALRRLSDDEFSRIIGYSDNMIGLALDIMTKEKVVGQKALEELAAIHEAELATEKEKLKVLKEARAKTKPQVKTKTKSKAKPKPRKPKIED